MDDIAIYICISLIITLLVGFLTFLKRKSFSPQIQTQQEVAAENEEIAAVRSRPRTVVAADAGAIPGSRNRAVANRNARARMRVAQAQQQQTHSDSEDEIEELGEEIALPDGKVGKKKLAKLQMKADKRAVREAEEKEREEKKERDEQKAEQRKLLEKEREEEEARIEEEERKRREEEEKREQEEYERLKVEFEIEEEGCDEMQDEEKERDLLKEFVNYIKQSKVVVLEDLAALFNLKTQAVINRIEILVKEGTLTGVVDDRGKFIYISQSELEGLSKFIRQRGRVSITELAEASNSLINLNPDTKVES